MSMNESSSSIYPKDKKLCYDMVARQLRSLFDGDNYLIPNLSNASAILNEAMDDINWVGFYLMHKGELLLGPFQGKVACVHIPIGKGVCGTAVEKDQTMLVKDVHEFPGHIACDSASNSEIVIPIHYNNQVIGVLDIDSPLPSRFDETDKAGLEEIVSIIETHCDFSTM